VSKQQSIPKGGQDHDLILGIVRGDGRILDAIYKDYYPMIWNFIRTHGGDEDEAQDIFQEALMVIYDKSKQHDFELSCKLKTYLYSICRRLWLKQLQRNGRHTTPIADVEELVPVEDDLEWHRMRDVQFSHMEEALGQLGEPCQSILKDFYLQNLSMQAISEKFGYTNPENAKNQKYKCLQRLKKLFFGLEKGDSHV
jgi:RNA polymerase sigma factor (sigma-70 family)